MPTWKGGYYVRGIIDQHFYNKHGTYEGYNPFEADRIMKKLPSKIVWETCMCHECHSIETVYYDVTHLQAILDE
jgi:hypothetical protein